MLILGMLRLSQNYSETRRATQFVDAVHLNISSVSFQATSLTVIDSNGV